MNTIPMSDMDKLLPPIEQAKMMGLIKAPEQLQSDEKHNYMLYGMALTCIILVGGFLIQHILKKPIPTETEIFE